FVVVARAALERRQSPALRLVGNPHGPVPLCVGRSQGKPRSVDLEVPPHAFNRPIFLIDDADLDHPRHPEGDSHRRKRVIVLRSGPHQPQSRISVARDDQRLVSPEVTFMLNPKPELSFSISSYRLLELWS